MPATRDELAAWRRKKAARERFAEIGRRRWNNYAARQEKLHGQSRDKGA
jgi:hypothetical protein